MSFHSVMKWGCTSKKGFSWLHWQSVTEQQTWDTLHHLPSYCLISIHNFLHPSLLPLEILLWLNLIVKGLQNDMMLLLHSCSNIFMVQLQNLTEKDAKWSLVAWSTLRAMCKCGRPLTCLCPRPHYLKILPLLSVVTNMKIVSSFCNYQQKPPWFSKQWCYFH